MAGTKISDLPSAGALTGAELVPVVQSDVTKKTTITDILTSAGAGTVTSVNVSGGTTGLTTSGGPITTSGTITLAGTLDVDNGGTGATTASTARSNLGAAASGTNSDITSMTGVTGGISTPDFVQFDTTAGATTAVAKQYWDDNSGGLSYGMKGGNVTQNIGQQVYQRVYNNTGATIAKGSVVYATGSSGTRTTIAKALATSDGTSAAVIGITAENISNNSEGFIITEGEITGVSTSGIGDGEILWLSATTAGAYTDVKTTAPNHLVLVGYCVKGNSVGGGIVYVKLENGYEIGELHDVYVSSPANGQTLLYNATNSRWENHNLTAGSGITITNGAGSVTIAASAGGGTVTSVNVSGGTTGLTTSGGPVTGSGTITLAGTLDVDNGGTGQTSYSNGQLLIGNASGGLTKATLTAGSGISITNGNGSITLTAAGSGLGDVTGPVSATDNAIARYDGATGKIIKNSSDLTYIDSTYWSNLGVGGTSTSTKINAGGTLPATGSSGNVLSRAFANNGEVIYNSGIGNILAAIGFDNTFNLQASGTVQNYGHFRAADGTLGLGSSVSNNFGVWVQDLQAGGSNIAFYSGVQTSGVKTNYNIYAAGNAPNYFTGKVGITTNGAPSEALHLGNGGKLRLDGATSGYSTFVAPATGSNINYTLPSADGTNGQVLKTDGTGTLSWTSVGGTGTVTSVDVSGGTTGLTTSGGPITGAGTITLAGTLAVANGGTGATTASTARSNLSAAASGANSDITSMSGITGGISTADYVDFDTVNAQTPAVGRLYWDGGTTLSVGMTANVDGRVNESLYIYIKASAAITKGDVIMQDGAVGASGVLKAKPATTSLTNAQVILGVAAESISLNGFGLIQTHGYLSGLNTTGSAVSETWADGDQLYYNPSVAGGLTKTKPSAPYIKLPIAEVVNAGSGTSGSLIINIGASSTLGGTDSNVQFGTLSNSDVIVYDSTAQYWKNVAQSSLTAGSVVNALTINNSGTGDASGSTFNGSAAKTISYNSIGASPLAGSSSLTTVGTINSGTWNGSTIGVGYGGTGQTSYTDGQLLIGNSTGNTLTKATLTAGSNITITNGNGSITIASTGGTTAAKSIAFSLLFGG